MGVNDNSFQCETCYSEFGSECELLTGSEIEGEEDEIPNCTNCGYMQCVECREWATGWCIECRLDFEEEPEPWFIEKFGHDFLVAINSRGSYIRIISFCLFNFCLSIIFNDMNIFASSGSLMTIFGLLCMIRFSTIDKYLKHDEIILEMAVRNEPVQPTLPAMLPSLQLTFPTILSMEEARQSALRAEKASRLEQEYREELKAEFAGIWFTIVGTLIWAYGSYFEAIL